MKTLTLTVVLTLLLPALASMQAEDTKPPESVLLQARIAQLEAQLQDVSTQLQVCTARLMVSMQPETQKIQSQQRQKIEKDAGCTLDWSLASPACKPDPAPRQQSASPSSPNIIGNGNVVEVGK